MADFAAGAYDEGNPEIRGYKVDPRLSDSQFKVYVKGNKVIFAIRGSKEVMNDFVVNDLTGIAVGKEHLQLKQGRIKLKEIQEKYPNSQLELTGHSLGSLTASALGAENKLKTVGFNAGSSPLGGDEYQNFLKKTFDNDWVTSVLAEGDLVSSAAVKHIRPDKLHVIAHTGSRLSQLKGTVDRHFMSNFVGNEHLDKIDNLLKEKQVANRSNIIHELRNRSDESLEKRHEQLKTSLPGGGNIAINEGEGLFSGGFHAQYQPGKKLINLDGENVPGPGAKIYVNQAKGIMYTFDDKHKPHFLTGSMAEKGDALKKFAKNYDKGPTLFIDDSSGSPPTKQVALIPSHGGAGWDFVPATSKKDWKTVLGGFAQHGKSGGWWSGRKSTKGFVGQAAVNPFVNKPPGTIDDTWGDVVDSTGEFLANNAISLLQIGGEIAADLISGGTASAVIQSLNLAVGSTGLDSDLQAEISKLLPNRQRNLGNVENIFDAAKTADGTAPFKNKEEDPVITFDDRIPFRVDEAQKNYTKLKRKGEKVRLTREEEAKLRDLRPATISTENQKDQAKDLETLEHKYTFMDKSFDAVDTLKDYNHKAGKAGLTDLTMAAYNDTRKNMIPDRAKAVASAIPSNFKKIITDVSQNLNNAVKNKMATSGDIYKKYEDQMLSWQSADRQPLLDVMAKKEDFAALYKGPEEEKEQEFSKYQREMWKAYKTQQGLFSGVDIENMHSDDRYFAKRYLKDHPIEKEKYINPDFFANRASEMTHLVDSQQRIQHQIVEKADSEKKPNVVL